MCIYIYINPRYREGPVRRGTILMSAVVGFVGGFFGGKKKMRMEEESKEVMSGSKGLTEMGRGHKDVTTCRTNISSFGGIRKPLFAIALFLGLFAGGGECLKDVDVDVPAAVSLGDTVALRCSFDLEGESLYTVKWYQGKKEFFRYVPKELPPTKVFPLPGVNVDVSASGAHQVVLTDVQLSMSGRYRCEVSADAPSFHTEMVAKVMNVVDYPEGKPTLKVEKRRYGVGDTLRANCTAPASSPPANLTWLLNGRYLNESLVRRYQSKDMDSKDPKPELLPLPPTEEGITGKPAPPTGKVTWTSGLEADIEGSSFIDGRLHLRCVATLFAVWSDSAETVIEEERPRLASVLGTRESSHGRGGALRERGELWLLPLAALSSLVLGRR